MYVVEHYLIYQTIFVIVYILNLTGEIIDTNYIVLI